jgi:AAA+ ATPase superfamily predicted ATPase
LFDLHPKEHRNELFGRDSELEYLLEQLLAGNWVVVGGQREIGKTSLVKVAIRELKEKHGFNGAYVNLRGVRSLNALLTSLIPEMNSSRVKLDLSFNVNFIMGSAGIQVKRDAKAVSSLNELLNSVHEDFVIALDEVQELSQASKQFLDILGNVFSSNSRVRFLFTGSYIGVTRILIDPPSASPLHGRPPVILNLRPFNDNTSRVFLRKGMREIGVDFNGEEEVVKRLDGVVGWLPNHAWCLVESVPVYPRASRIVH